MKKDRIRTFDYIRGYPIIIMILVHIFDQFLITDVKWFAALIYLIVSPWGIPGFVFASGMSFGYSWVVKSHKKVDYKANAWYSLSRSIIILGIAFIFNLVAVFIHTLPWYNIWFWYILQTLAISRILGIWAMKASPKMRIVISFGIIGFGHYLLMFLLPLLGENKFAYFFYFILYNSIQADSLLIFFPMFLIGTVCGEIIFNKSVLPFYTTSRSISELDKELLESEIYIKNNQMMLNLFYGAGILLVMLGIIIGRSPASYYYGWEWLLIELKKNSDLNITEIPLFLTRGSYAWIFFSSGVMILTFSLLFRFLDLKRAVFTNFGNKYKYRKEIKNELNNELKTGPKREITSIWIKITSILKILGIKIPLLFGNYSLSIYLVQYFLYLLPFSLNITWAIILFLITTAIFYIVFLIIDRYMGGKISIEYLITEGAQEIMKKVKALELV